MIYDVNVLEKRADVFSAGRSAVIKTLLYFDIFNYPLTAQEITANCQGLILPKMKVENILMKLLHKGFISRTESFYHFPGKEKTVQSRKERNALADLFLGNAEKYGGIIASFPFVEAVLITGSLAKNCMDKKSDIDYLVITKPGRLWLARGLLTIFKKIVLLNSRKYFCINYYLDSESLCVPDENIYTATEVVYARPAYNIELCKRFLENNKGANRFYPGMPLGGVPIEVETKQVFIKRFLEAVFNGIIGKKLDDIFFTIFRWQWKGKFMHKQGSSFEVNFRSRKNVSKHHPHGFQFRVIKEFNKKIEQFQSDNKINLL